ASVQLGVDRLALRIVPVLVDPAQSHVVRPTALKFGFAELLDHAPQRRGWNRNEICHTHRSVDARQLGGEGFKHKLKQEGKALGLVVSQEGLSDLSKVFVGAAFPAASQDRWRAQGFATWPR